MTRPVPSHGQNSISHSLLPPYSAFSDMITPSSVLQTHTLAYTAAREWFLSLGPYDDDLCAHSVVAGALRIRKKSRW